MRLRTIVLCASLAAPLAIATPAQAFHVATGTTCGLATNDATATQFGVATGGPVVATGVLPTVTVTCAIQVNQPFHGGVPSVVVTATGTQTATLQSQVAYATLPGDLVYLCTTWTFNGVTWYWNALVNAWALVPTRVPCAIAMVTPYGGVTAYTVVPLPTDI